VLPAQCQGLGQEHHRDRNKGSQQQNDLQKEHVSTRNIIQIFEYCTLIENKDLKIDLPNRWASFTTCWNADPCIFTIDGGVFGIPVFESPN
jgi:hypothetical protein